MQAFQMEQGEVEGPIPTPTGPAFVTVIDEQDSLIPPLEDVQVQVRRDLIRRKSLELAREKATNAANSLQDAENFLATAEAAELTVSTSELIARGAAFPEVGVNPELERIAFSLSVGDVSDVVDTGNTVAIVRVCFVFMSLAVSPRAASTVFRFDLRSRSSRVAIAPIRRVDPSISIYRREGT